MKRLVFLDGLRGWGAVVVVLYHIFCLGFPVSEMFGPGLNKIVVFDGPYAVLVFFIISGFSLSIGYLTSGDARSLLSIASGRYLRLAIPILAACAIVHLAVLAGFVIAPDQRLEQWRNWLGFDPTIGHLLRFSMFDVFFNYRHSDSYIGPLWTMGAELIGSWIILAMIGLLRPNRARPVILAMLGYVLVVFIPFDSVRILSLFFFGASLADCYQRGWANRIPSAAGLAMIVIGCGVPFFFVWRVDIVNTAGVLSLTLGCLVAGPVRQLLSGPLSMWLGRISFPLYLMHDPVIILVGEPLTRNFGHDPAMQLLINVSTVTVSFMAAHAFTPVNRFAISVARCVGQFTADRLFPRPELEFHG